MLYAFTLPVFALTQDGRPLQVAEVDGEAEIIGYGDEWLVGDIRLYDLDLRRMAAVSTAHRGLGAAAWRYLHSAKVRERIAAWRSTIHISRSASAADIGRGSLMEVHP